MEAELGNFADARSIFERVLKLFRSPSVDKTAIWRAYEVIAPMPSDMISVTSQKAKPSKRNKEVEVSSWSNGSDVLDAEVWMNNGSIEGRVPASMMRKLKNKRL